MDSAPAMPPTLALDDMLSDFELTQRRALLTSVDKAIDTVMKQQGAMLVKIKETAQVRHEQALAELRDELAQQQPSLVDTLIARTLDVEKNPGLLNWIHDDAAKEEAFECVLKLRGHLEARQGNAFRSDFENLLVVYMAFLRISMARGSRLGSRIEDFQDALQKQAGRSDDLANLMFRVRWACYGVRTIGNARSHDASPLTESEILELCGCFSAIGASMPTLSQEFDVCKPQLPMAPAASDVNGTGNGSATASGLEQLAQQLGVSVSPELLLQLLTSSINNNNGASSSSLSVLPGFPTISSTNVGMAGSDNGVGSIGIGGGSGGWASPSPVPISPPPPTAPASSSGHSSPERSQAPASMAVAVAVPRPPPPPGFAVQRAAQPTQAALALVPTYTFYHDRPTELPKESDRVRMAMFARMINHMKALPKATLCPFPPGHDPSCPRAHTYLDAMKFNPLFKRLICRQPSHYWGSQVQEDENCVCVHVDTGLKWEWMDEARDKRMYCARGKKCTNHKCFKSHSFEEMCWYNPSYKIKKCTVRAHDHIVRGRGTLAPPLDCNFYHIEEGHNADKRELTNEDDHVGQDKEMLFVERTHKPLADALEALRFARANNL